MARSMRSMPTKNTTEYCCDCGAAISGSDKLSLPINGGVLCGGCASAREDEPQRVSDPEAARKARRAANKSTRFDGQHTLRKGDRFRFTQDYYVCVRVREPGKVYGRDEDRLVAAAGTEGRVIWAGRSKDNPALGTWRVGVMLPGASKPRFLNQRYMERIA